MRVSEAIPLLLEPPTSESGRSTGAFGSVSGGVIISTDQPSEAVYRHSGLSIVLHITWGMIVD